MGLDSWGTKPKPMFEKTERWSSALSREAALAGINHLETAVAEYVDWFNHRRLHGEIDHVPPVEYGQLHAGHPAPELLSLSY